MNFTNGEKQLTIADIAISALAVILFGIFRPDMLMIAVYFLIYPYLFLTARKSAFYHLFIASIISLVWMLIAKNEYSYNKDMLVIFGINLFPLFAWASGLFAAYMIYSHWEHKFKFSRPIKKMLLFIAFYWPMLISLETIGYHIFNIKNLAAAAYAGLPICNCIHAPVWMQISYLILGPLYFGICELIGLENPHYKRKTV